MDEQKGFKLIFMGAMQGFRNPKAHQAAAHTNADHTLEYREFAGLLVRRIDDTIAR